MRRLLIATHNPGKVREYRALLADLPLTVTFLDELGITEDVDETETTFEGNAVLKARAYSEMTGLWTWADDSGLEVDALDKRPGVYSARYGGPGLNDQQRYELVLSELQAHPPETWTARFRCVVAIVTPEGKVNTRDGSIEGVITDRPRGNNGFGYDPIFYVPSLEMTLAEAASEVKNNISHRAEAAAAAKVLLAQMISESAGNEA
ncbi:MAG: RdgB/HAM1 family non-canonical purine NTP pyrophosphatase [Caldilineaceae bacterium]|nr:RdgB/HAM1 family non-canonical purine NTP pyrophosphatase [Caldilineaceae bacterium]